MTNAAVQHIYDEHYLSYYLEVKSQSATNVTLHPLGLGLFEYTFKNAQWRTSKTNTAIVTLYLLMQVL